MLLLVTNSRTLLDREPAIPSLTTPDLPRESLAFTLSVRSPSSSQTSVALEVFPMPGGPLMSTALRVGTLVPLPEISFFQLRSHVLSVEIALLLPTISWAVRGEKRSVHTSVEHSLTEDELVRAYLPEIFPAAHDKSEAGLFSPVPETC